MTSCLRRSMRRPRHAAPSGDKGKDGEGLNRRLLHATSMEAPTSTSSRTNSFSLPHSETLVRRSYSGVSADSETALSRLRHVFLLPRATRQNPTAYCNIRPTPTRRLVSPLPSAPRLRPPPHTPPFLSDPHSDPALHCKLHRALTDLGLHSGHGLARSWILASTRMG